MAEKPGLRALMTLGRVAVGALGRSLKPRALGPAAGQPFERAMKSLLADPAVAASIARRASLRSGRSPAGSRPASKSRRATR